MIQTVFRSFLFSFLLLSAFNSHELEGIKAFKVLQKSFNLSRKKSIKFIDSHVQHVQRTPPDVFISANGVMMQFTKTSLAPAGARDVFCVTVHVLALRSVISLRSRDISAFKSLFRSLHSSNTHTIIHKTYNT